MDATVPDIGRRDVGIDATSPDASNDAMDASDAGSDEPRVEVGTGSTQFEPLTEGQVVDFTAGPQGGGQFFGFHIWFGARTWNLNPEAVSVTFIVLKAGDRSELARLNWVTNFRPTATDAYEIWGGTPRLSDCCAAASQPLVMRVEVLDVEGKSATGEIGVMGASQCTDFSGDLCP